MTLNIDLLQKFAQRGQAAQEAVDTLIRSARECPYCGNVFLPNSWNQKFCSYAHRHLRREELRHKLKYTAPVNEN
jgi:ribosomal protein S27AE